MAADVREKSKQILRMIDAAGSIAIIGHVRPDGDCIGSVLGMYNYILDNYTGKTVDVYAESFSPDFKFLNGAKKIKHEHAGKSYDLAISIDVSEPSRMGKFETIFNTAISTVCIDHHVTNPGFGDVCYVDPDASSAGEVLTALIDMEKVSLNTAEALYLAMVHDTGVFKYGCTRRNTMEVAGRFVEMGVRTTYIIDETFYKKTYKQNLLMAKTVLESNLLHDGKIIVGFISKETMKEFKATKPDLEGIVEQLRLTDGVEVAVFVHQTKKKEYKFSLRAKNYVDVGSIALTLGGGGHEKAAGFEYAGEYEEALSKLLTLIKEQLK